MERFGSTFRGTKCFHIIHNLDPLYEGRLYPSEGDSDPKLQRIHELPLENLIDPLWQTIIVNPSRCAILNTDNWGTVSNSYKIELLKESPLNSILLRFPKPFAFPNGIRREQRFKLIMEKTNNDHLAAKAIL